MRLVALAAALVGGVCLVANLFVDRDVVSWVGLGLVGVALALVGAGLVRAAWLSLVAAAGSVALGWAVLGVLRDAVPTPDREVDAITGGVATLCVAIAMLRRPSGNQRA